MATRCVAPAQRVAGRTGRMGGYRRRSTKWREVGRLVMSVSNRVSIKDRKGTYDPMSVLVSETG